MVGKEICTLNGLTSGVYDVFALTEKSTRKVNQIISFIKYLWIKFSIMEENIVARETVKKTGND